MDAVNVLTMSLTDQTMYPIKLFKIVDTNAGAIRTVIVEIKYISSNNVAIPTENPKLEISLDCTRSRNVDFTLEVLTLSNRGILETGHLLTDHKIS